MPYLSYHSCTCTRSHNASRATRGSASCPRMLWHVNWGIKPLTLWLVDDPLTQKVLISNPLPAKPLQCTLTQIKITEKKTVSNDFFFSTAIKWIHTPSLFSHIKHLCLIAVCIQYAYFLGLARRVLHKTVNCVWLINLLCTIDTVCFVLLLCSSVPTGWKSLV